MRHASEASDEDRGFTADEVGEIHAVLAEGHTGIGNLDRGDRFTGRAGEAAEAFVRKHAFDDEESALWPDGESAGVAEVPCDEILGRGRGDRVGARGL